MPCAARWRHCKGSPPRVRGKEWICLDTAPRRGITPACAGKSIFRPLLVICFRDHPRVCGEKNTKATAKRKLVGSPPRVRGKVCADAVSSQRQRITPACAGKRPSSPFSNILCRDHPRVCGEKVFYSCRIFNHVGSPPRVRGKALHVTDCGAKPGITPACAGKSLSAEIQGLEAEDHPRVCGEKSPFPACLALPPGSPPRVRGKAQGEKI